MNTIIAFIKHYWYKIVRKFKQPEWSKDSKAPIKWAFNCGGIDYYAFVDPFTIPYQRGLVSIAIYEQFNMRVTREHLKTTLTAIKECVNSKDGEIRLSDLIGIVNDLEARLDWVVELDTTYKLASIVYFDKTEDPMGYNETYNYNKIKHWKQFGVRDFFLRLPLKDLIPFIGISEKDMETYLKKVQKESVQQAERVLQVLSKSGSENSLAQELKSQMEELKELKI